MLTASNSAIWNIQCSVEHSCCVPPNTEDNTHGSRHESRHESRALYFTSHPTLTCCSIEASIQRLTLACRAS